MSSATSINKIFSVLRPFSAFTILQMENSHKGDTINIFTKQINGESWDGNHYTRPILLINACFAVSSILSTISPNLSYFSAICDYETKISHVILFSSMVLKQIDAGNTLQITLLPIDVEFELGQPMKGIHRLLRQYAVWNSRDQSTMEMKKASFWEEIDAETWEICTKGLIFRPLIFVFRRLSGWTLRGLFRDCGELTRCLIEIILWVSS